MKNTTFLSMLFVALSLSFSACSNNSSDDITPIVIENNVKSGQWRITSFIDSGDDETNHFNGYTFTFADNGSLTATNGPNTYTGSWSITDSNSNDDSPDDIDFNISFSTPADFEELSEDWDIISQSSSRIELRHVSGGNGGIDNLVFEKI
jgi:hypothetical protein